MFRRVALLLLLLVLGSASAFAQSAKPDNTLPFYGGGMENECHLEVNRAFIEEATRIAGTRERAAEAALKRGWDYMRIRDTETAIKRFNQAWLLTPDNPNVFWAFGAVEGSRGKFDESVKLFERSRAIAPKNPLMLVDFAYSLIWKGNNGSKSLAERDAAFARAHGLLDEAELMEPKYPLLHANRAILCFFQGDYAAAWRNVDRAQALEPRSVQEPFLRELSSRMPRPAKQ